MFNGSTMPFTMNVEPAGCNNGNGNNNGFGGDNWIIWLFFILAIFWGGNGFGNGGNNGGGVMDAYVLNSDFATLQRQLDSGFSGVTAGINQVNNGLCQGFYQQAQLVNGVQMQLANEFRGTDNAICTLGYNLQSGINSLANQIAQCCCDTKQAIAETNYNLATQACQTRQVINDAVRSLHDEIVANRIEDKNAEIARQSQQIFSLQLQASQSAQNQYLIDQLGEKCPVKAYPVCNPNGPLNYGIGFNNGCNNGCFGCGG